MAYSENIEKHLSILLITPFFSPNVGGVETHLDDLCTYLQKRGHTTHVITYTPLTTNVKALKFERKQNLTIRRLDWFGRNFFHKLEPYPLLEFVYLTPVLLAYSLIFFVGYRNDVDVIHAHGLNAAFVAKVLTRLFKKKAVVSIHAIYDLSKRPMLAKLMRSTLCSFDSILTLANRSKTELMGIGLDENRIKVFTYWVGHNAFKPLNKAECKKELELENKFVVLFVGRLLEIKGVRVLIEVAKRLSNKKDVLFVFVGDGPLANEVKLASDTSENIIYFGKVENSHLNIYYNAADIVAVPSMYEEGFGRVILEALSCGTPVIASNKGGIPEAMDPRVGILIDPNIDEIQQVIVTLCTNPATLVNLRRNCRTYAEKKFSENNAMLIENAYARA